MRLIGKLLALPFVLVIIEAKSRGIYEAPGMALVLFFIAGFWPGLSWLVVAFLLSPYGLPMAAAWLVGMIGGVNGSLKDFIFG